MLEGLVTWVLNTYIGEYVENLNTDQLTIGIFQGQVELENLPLKRTALNALDLPIEVKSGFIGKVQLQIPIRRLQSEQWVITLDKLYLVAGPIKDGQFDAEDERKREEERKRQQLKELEDNFRLQQEIIQERGVTSKASSWWSYGASFFTNIVENLQLKVNDIHLRYEDDVTIPGCSFACGVTIKSVAAQSADSNWLPGFVSRSGSDLVFKLVSLENFSIYFDTEVTMIGGFGKTDLEEALKSETFISSTSKSSKTHAFILEPVSASAKMKRYTTAQPLRGTDTPRLSIDIEMDKFPLSLSELQMHRIVALLRELDRYDRSRKYRRFRPNCSVTKNCGVWWKYAISATCHTIKERQMKRSRQFICQRARDIVQYTKTYQEYLTINPKYMNKGLKDFMDEFEAATTFDELKLLRKLVTDELLEKEKQMSVASASLETPIDEVVTSSESDQPQSNPGILQRWFPGWGGWYGYGYPPPLQSASASEGNGDSVDAISSRSTGDQSILESTANQIISPAAVNQNVSIATKTDLDQEIIDALSDSADSNTLLKQDAVLVQLNFCLQTLTLQLLSDSTSKTSSVSGSLSLPDDAASPQCLLQLECSVVRMSFQSRPRTKGMKFSISVNDLWLRDKMTINSIRPTLIAPLHREKTGLHASGSNTSFRNQNLQDVLLENADQMKEEKLFELVYEKRPLRTKADYKLLICTKPLDIIYNPATIQRIIEFFTVKKSDTQTQKAELEIAVAAKNQYELFKKQTQDEFKQTIDALLEGESGTRAKRWIFDLNISAPHITIPESFKDSNSRLVVFDLGHLQLCNARNEVETTIKVSSDDEDEDFVTPSSTPPNEEDDSAEKESTSETTNYSFDKNLDNLSESTIRSKIYERYTLTLSDLQVMVGRTKDSDWKAAYSKRTSLLHVVDKFSISLQFERRLLYTSHPDCPNVLLSGRIPQLVLHINEEKIAALKLCFTVLQMQRMTTDNKEPVSVSRSTTTTTTTGATMDRTERMHSSRTALNINSNKASASSGSKVFAEDVIDQPTLISMEFSIDQISLEVQTLDCNHPQSQKLASYKSLAELQVSQVQAMLVKKVVDTSVKFSIHSLLVVDALQTFGPDYELLVASHKNFCLDSRSGKINESHTASPSSSPCSPVSLQSPAEPSNSSDLGLHGNADLNRNAGLYVTNKLQNLTRMPTSSTNLSGDGTLNLVPSSSLFLQSQTEALITIEVDLIKPRSQPPVDSHDETICFANIEFNSLDIIANQYTIVELVTFFRKVFPAKLPSKEKIPASDVFSDDAPQDKETSKEIRKELTANFHRLNILLMRVDESDPTKKFARKVATVTLAKAKIEASFVNSLSIEGSLCGLQLLDLTPEGYKHHQKVLHVGIDPSRMSSVPCDVMSGKAFTFCVSRPDSADESRPERSRSCNEVGEMLVVLRVASVYYLHAPILLMELSQCVTEFKDYLSKISNSLTVAAKELALGLVNGRKDVTTTYGSNWSLDGKFNRWRSVGATGSSDDLIFASLSSFAERETFKRDADDEKRSRMDFKLDAILESPVILLPKSPTSREILSLCLGKIIISNFDFDESICAASTDVVSIEVRDMSMYSLTLDALPVIDISSCMESSSISQILHKTTLDLTLVKLKANRVDPGLSDFLRASPHHNSTVLKHFFNVDGQISPLKLELTKQNYEQILSTLDNITPDPSDSDPIVVDENVSVSSDQEKNELKKKKEHDEEEEASAGGGYSNVKTNSDPSNEGDLVVVKGSFKLPALNVLFVSLFGETEKGLVDIRLENFLVDLRSTRSFKSMDISLESLVVEDLLHQEKSSTGHQYMMVSHGTSRSATSSAFSSASQKVMSQSCPTNFLDLPLPAMPLSLPSSLDQNQENLFTRNATQRKRLSSSSARYRDQAQQAAHDYPCTPPPSPHLSSSCDRLRPDPLVHIKVNLVDKKCPDFETRYNKVHRRVSVDFNSLETRVNLETWVLVLEFLGIGGKVWDPELFTKKSQALATEIVPAADDKEVVNMEVDLKVQSLSLILNKKDYELTKAIVTSFESHISTHDNNLEVKGQLGSVSLQDSSPSGHLYRERFITTGHTALDFHFFKYGVPDPDGLREFDVSVKLTMASVWYVHSQRFIQETIAFTQNFNQCQDYLGRSRAATAGKKIAEKASHNARIKMDIDAGAPLILIPHSSRTKDVLVFDLGKLRIQNKFMFDGDDRPEQENQRTDDATQGNQRKAQHEKKKSKASDDERSSRFDDDDNIMTKSVFGSLDGDWRKQLETTEDPSFRESVVSGLFSALSSSSARFTTRIGGVVENFAPSLRGDVVSSSSRSPLSVDERRNESKRKTSDLDASSSAADENYKCLLDVMEVELFDTELYSAERIDKSDYKFTSKDGDDLVFPSFVIVRERRKILKEKCRLCLQVKRNLDVDLSHAVPDISVKGKLSSVQLVLDLNQYQLIRGILAHNFGEPLEEFQNPLMSHLKDPKIQSVLSGNLSIGLFIILDLDNVEVGLLVAHEDSDCQEVSLARFDFVQSQLQFESRSDGSKDIGLVSHEIKVHDTRYKDLAVNVRPNIFSEILRPSPSCFGHEDFSLQLELHCRLNRQISRYTILLNNMRVLGIFDWLLAVKDFLSMSPADPFKEDQEMKDKGTSLSRNMFTTNSGSILTKRIPAIEQKEPLLELCVNMTNTELVIVENSADRDTNAIIIKGTAVLSYRQKLDRPLNCNLQSLEVFSCSVSSEDETALSIIDPMSFTLELNMTQEKTNSSAGLLDAACYNERPPILEISFQSLSIRLSYNDMKLFSSIINSMPQQLLKATKKALPPKNASMVAKLEALGFSSNDCEEALKRNGGQLENAVTWLTKNAQPVPIGKSTTKKRFLNISGLEIKGGGVSLCLIDDCQDADVPLAEIMLNSIHILHHFLPHSQGKAQFALIGDYYNRSLSGWEPFVEKIGCKVEWNEGVMEEEDKLYLSIQADANETLNMNFTRSLIDQYTRTKTKWIDDYNATNTSKENWNQNNSRKRTPFVPYAIRNKTGCNLKFITVNSSPGQSADQSRSHLMKERQQRETERWMMEGNWKNVLHGSELTFLIDEREKIRHKVTHELNVHQLRLKIDGWKEIGPVSVDKVGVFFRSANADIDSVSKIFQDMPSARVVFEVKIEGSARKVVTVRSALILNNQLEDPLEVKLEKIGSHTCTMKIPPLSNMPLPLEFVYSKLWVRPFGWSLEWSSHPINWQTVSKAGESNDSINDCNNIGGSTSAYRFCVSIYKQRYPDDDLRRSDNHSSSEKGSLTFTQPGHVITIMPTLRVENLLPIDLNFTIAVAHTQCHSSTIKPGKKAFLMTIDLSQTMELGVTLENFSKCKEMVIPAGTTDYKVKMYLFDTEDRLLELQVYIKAGLGGSLKLSISAPYWLINRTGLPLLFKQDNGTMAAGQFPEHEIARSVVPLLFCFADKLSNEMCTMRIGNSVHGPGTSPQWCNRFLLERGMTVRQVHVTQHSRPDWVYVIGIESRQGRGAYCDTNIVTFTPRFQLDNRSSNKLAFTQRHFINTLGPNPSNYLSALPNCILPFHWPRVDLDTLLCVRIMDVPSCNWSGGFQIDTIDSFHINMRDENNKCLFLHVDIVLNGATYVVVFTDAEQMPPPYRIDNFSQVPVQFYQTRVPNEQLKTYIKPRTSMAYMWDEPTLPSLITLKVPSGTNADYDMNKVGNGEQLCYENFIYIAFTHTFKSQSSSSRKDDVSSGYKHFEESQKLVLDVLPPDRVILRKKESGKRSQLWRMTSTGLLQHEGSSVPRDPKKHNTSSVTYVLDIKDIALQPNREMPMTIRKPDERRKSSQIWKFIEGRLCCGDKKNLVVQAKDGIFGLRDGGEAVLGPALPTSRSGNPQELPKEMAIHREKLQPGSGCLCVKILNDGPTRVLQITDIAHQKYEEKLVNDDWFVVDERKRKPKLKTEEEGSPIPSETLTPRKTYEISIHLPAGLGISVVDTTPVELVYLSLHNVRVEYLLSSSEQVLQLDVMTFQMDNQLFGSHKPVLLFLSPPSSKPDPGSQSNVPAISICAHKISSGSWNAEIYKQLLINVKPTTLQMEEKTLLKLMQFIGFNKTASELETVEECHGGSTRMSPLTTLTNFKRYYFGTIDISKFEISLSMYTTRDLPLDLKAIKRSLHMPLVRFEDAQVELDPFKKFHLFETSAFLWESIKLHYTRELKSQAAKILGSVDFLGNPLGLFSDMAEGVSCLLEGNVGGLLKNVTRGVTNTYAKVSGTLSDTVEIATFDKRHQLERRQIFDEHREGGRDHLKAGFRSLLHGMLGAITSIPLQTYTEVQDKGAVGLVSGITKGVVGTFTKPVTGILDFTSGTASAIRDQSKGYYHKRPSRVRKPRCCYGNAGLLPAYSSSDSDALELLFQKNHNNYDEMVIAKYQLQSSEQMYILISSQMLYFMGRDNEIILSVAYQNLIACRWLHSDGRFYIELTASDNIEKGITKRPKVRCDSEDVAQQVVQHINYAKNIYDDVKQTLPLDDNIANDYND